MPAVHNIFCPECDSILDISKTTTKKIIDLDESPSSVSDENDDKIGNLIKQLLTEENIDNLMENIKIDKITSHDAYKKLDKNKKQILNEKLEKYSLTLVDTSMVSYYLCKSCSWSQKLKPETQILTKTGGDSQTSYLNSNRYKNKIYSRVLPYTRNYICPNKNCSGNKDPEKHEAVIYRINDTMRTMYTCCACQEVFGAQ
jgi:hypothetical protein